MQTGAYLAEPRATMANIYGLARAQVQALQALRLQAAASQPTLYPGVISVQDYDPVIEDALRREFPIWSWIEKLRTNHEFTDGFDQTGYGTARSADKRNLGYSPSNPARAPRTPQEIKAIVRDIQFGLLDASLATLGQNRDLTGKDVEDCKFSMLYLWSELFHEGDVAVDALQFDGIRKQLGAGVTIEDTESVYRAIQAYVRQMMDSKTKGVRPTHIIGSATVAAYISQEMQKAGDSDLIRPRMPVSDVLEPTLMIDTVAGFLPYLTDPFCTKVDSQDSPPVDLYPTYIVTKRKVRHRYVPVLGMDNPEPQVLDFSMTTAGDAPWKGVMFPALEVLGTADHHRRLNVKARTSIVDINTNHVI